MRELHGRSLVDAWMEPRRRMDGASSTHGRSLVDAWTEPRRCMDEKHNTSIKSFQSTIAETEAGIEMLSRLRPLYMKNWIRKKK